MKALIRGTCVMALCCTSGCFKSRILVRVNGDGSGHLVVTRMFSREAVLLVESQLAEMSDQGPAGHPSHGAEVPENPFYDEQSLRRGAGQFGAGVVLAQSREYSKGGARGSVAVYSFEDVREIFINPEMLADEPMAPRVTGVPPGEPEPAERAENAFEFRFEAGPTNCLRIVVPDYPPPPADVTPDLSVFGAEFGGDDISSAAGSGMGGPFSILAGSGNPFGFTGTEKWDDVLVRVLDGLDVRLSVEVVGAVSVSDLAHADPVHSGRFTLFNVNMRKVVAAERGRNRLLAAAGGTPCSLFDVLVTLRGLDGMTLETNREVSVSFVSEASGK